VRDKAGRQEMLRTLVGYHPDFIRDGDSQDVPEICWACEYPTSWSIAVIKQTGSLRFLAPLCRVCYDEFKEMHVTELVAWELMK